MRKRKPIVPLHRRLKWNNINDRHWFTDRRGWVAINLTHIHGTSYRVAAGTLDEVVTAKASRFQTKGGMPTQIKCKRGGRGQCRANMQQKRQPHDLLPDRVRDFSSACIVLRL